MVNNLRTCTILIAEPNPIYADELLEILSQHDYRVVITEHAVDAILQVADGRACVFMIELRLPDMRTSDVMRIVRRMQPELPIIVMSHQNSQKLEAEVREVGLFYYLLKPFSQHELVTAVAAAESATRRASNG